MNAIALPFLLALTYFIINALAHPIEKTPPNKVLNLDNTDYVESAVTPVMELSTILRRKRQIIFANLCAKGDISYKLPNGTHICLPNTTKDYDYS